MIAKIRTEAEGVSKLRGFIQFVWNWQRAARAIVLVALFAFSFFRKLMFFSDPGSLNQPVEPWKTIRLVAQFWEGPKTNMIEASGCPDDTPIDELPRRMTEYLDRRVLTIAKLQPLIEQTQEGLGRWMWQ
ncbi:MULTISPECIES: hypothetical protein [unclassified Sulfitobacter]|uniref:hypothetical protein n=1 Tax=unclassified Sulfitobacter TaxID=196795 RepID=UPI003745885F